MRKDALCIAAIYTRNMSDTVTLNMFCEALQSPEPDAVFIDVRTPEEYAAWHIEGVINMPIDTVQDHLEELRSKDAIYVHCQRGGRAGRACALLDGFGLTNVRKFTGGLDEWREAGLPIATGRSTHLADDSLDSA